MSAASPIDIEPCLCLLPSQLALRHKVFAAPPQVSGSVTSAMTCVVNATLSMVVVCVVSPIAIVFLAPLMAFYHWVQVGWGTGALYPCVGGLGLITHVIHHLGGGSGYSQTLQTDFRAFTQTITWHHSARMK